MQSKVMEFPKWTGNLTLRMGVSVKREEDTYSPGCILVKEYEPGYIALEFLSREEQGGIAITRFGLEQWKDFIAEAIDFTEKLS